MLRVLLRVVTALVLALVLVAPVLIGQAPQDGGGGPDPVRITHYEADYDVARDGTLTATETITARFPAGRHGIFRYWDVADTADDSVRYRPRDIEVTRGGASEPMDLSWEQGRRFRVARIGDPDRTVPAGEHTYVITYEVPGVLAPGVGEERSEFVWQVVAAGWSMTMDRVDVTVRLPHLVDRLDCSVGASTTACDLTQDDAGDRSTLTFTRDTPLNTSVLLSAGMDAPAPERLAVPWSIEWDPALGVLRTWTFVLIALSVATGLWGYTLDRRTRERAPGFPVLYEPPAGLGPAQVAYVTTESVPGDALGATLLHLAEQELVSLREVDGGWEVTGTGSSARWREANPIDRHVGEKLGVTDEGAVFAMQKKDVKAGEKLSKLKRSLAGEVEKWALDSGAFVRTYRETLWRGLTIVALICTITGVVVQIPSIWLVPFATFAVGAVGVFWTGVGRRRTPAGRDLWSRAGGFRRFLSTDSAQDRFDFSGRQNLYTAYIPYAVALGVAAQWASKYEVATGAVAPVPAYLYANQTTGGGSSSLSAALQDFDSALSSSISAYTASQSSSSGGGGGGGFSGGGGGGGGGGSW